MTVISFIGAGSVEFTRDLVADLLRFPDLGDVELRLHDIDDTRLRTAEGVARSIATQLGAAPTIVATADRRAALDGADFVVNIVQIGGLAATRTDFAVPAKYGLRQTIADTLGVGGIFRALRTFPFLSALAKDITELCPEALLLNYTNPMAMNIWYLSRVAPQVRAYGLCHSVYWTVVGLCEVMGVPYEEVDYHSAGVNHQAWLLSMERAGQDLYPLLDAKIDADPELRRRVRVDMYRRLGYYPTETSEHSSEYVPWYLKDPGEISRLRIPVDAYVAISEENVATFELTRDIVAAGGQVTIESGATEYAPQVIHSVVTGTPRRIQVNVPNTGLITNLPTGAGVEVPATVDRSGVHPWHVGDLPVQCAALNRSFLNVGELTVQAAVTQDARMIRQAAMVDPNAAATLTVDRIWALCDDLVTAHGDLLEPWTVR
ncbi:alpha-glucosidase/alpha-galactosidase [Actinocrispum wychmicini]|uniref:Alpha-galactosidase n=1 Tax=Actinocrispum wychmicini TaxID=1213861 RepID=A0A4R2J9B6_9PSEU|nr:alpha-glucosidase/alpha-galactosidase [Actinocrispum wychmicini]TCO54827.1 alpha-galactosidase [Actinocrispum wychmicini]